MARAFDLAVTPWSPLGQGVLTGKYNKPREAGQESRFAEGETSRYMSEKSLSIAQAVVDIAGEIGVSPAQVALAWLLEKGRNHDGVMIPIIGSRKASQLADNMGAVDVRLNEAQLAKLNDISAFPLPFPQSFVNNDRVNAIVYGGTRGMIDTHRPSVAP